jgi:hypothetical protein
VTDDKFLEEVEGRMRSDRYREMASGALPMVVGAVVLIIVVLLGVWGWRAWQQKRADKASESYSAAMQAEQGGDFDGADRQFATIAKDGPGVYKALALMNQAALRLRKNQTQQAVALFDQAAKADSDPVISDNARLKSALALIDTAPYAQIEERLKPLLDKKRPYWIEAREALAMARLKAGMTAQAKSDFEYLGTALDAPDSLRTRAQQALGLIDSGAAGNLSALLKAKPVMPPLPPAQAPDSQAAAQAAAAQAAAAQAAAQGQAQSGAGQ